MLFVNFCLLFCVQLWHKTALADIVKREIAHRELVRPENTVGMVGKSVKLDCRGHSQKIIWDFKTPGSYVPNILVDYCKTDFRHRKTYKVDKKQHSCNLVIPSLTLAMAGMYICHDRSENSSASVARLVVLESDPSCSSSAGAESTVTAGTQVNLTCSVRYAGAYAPIMEWKDAFDTVISGSITATKDGLVESILTLTAKTPTLMPYTCKTYFDSKVADEVKTDEKGFRFIANNGFYYENLWTSRPLHVTEA